MSCEDIYRMIKNAEKILVCLTDGNGDCSGIEVPNDAVDDLPEEMLVVDVRNCPLVANMLKSKPQEAVVVERGMVKLRLK